MKLMKNTPLTPEDNILLTGVTGFLGQAILERLLVTTPAHATCLIRAKGSVSPAERLKSLSAAPVFSTWRSSVSDADEQWRDRVHVLSGDLTDDLVIPDGITRVVHSASIVNFDEPLDSAIAANTGGPMRLYAALERAGFDGPVVHISTSYVQATRVQHAYEKSVDHNHTWGFHLHEAEHVAEKLRRKAKKEGRSDAWLREALQRAGTKLSRKLGFTDIYTASKALGERAAEDLWGHQSLTIVRPTIIESALRYPYPGWIDGFKVADPLFAAYAQGRLTNFPGNPSNVVDIVPVDFVVEAVLASLENPAPVGAPRFLQVGTSTTNPLTLGELKTIVEEHFVAEPLQDKNGKNIVPPDWTFTNPKRSVQRLRIAGHAVGTAKALERRLPGSRPATRKKLAMLHRRTRTAQKFVNLYSPYTCAETVYENKDAHATIQLRSGDSTEIVWRDYLHDVHLPSLRKLIANK